MVCFAENLVVWNVGSGEAVARLFEKTVEKDVSSTRLMEIFVSFCSQAWPSIKWTDDEEVACRCVTNTVQFFEGKDIARGYVHTERMEGVTTVSLAPGKPPYHYATFIPAKKGKVAAVAVFRYPPVGKKKIVGTRSMGRVDAVSRSTSLCLNCPSSASDRFPLSGQGMAALFCLARRQIL